MRLIIFLVIFSCSLLMKEIYISHSGDDSNTGLSIDTVQFAIIDGGAQPSSNINKNGF